MESTAAMFEVSFKNRKSSLQPIAISKALDIIKKWVNLKNEVYINPNCNLLFINDSRDW